MFENALSQSVSGGPFGGEGVGEHLLSICSRHPLRVAEVISSMGCAFCRGARLRGVGVASGVPVPLPVGERAKGQRASPCLLVGGGAFARAVAGESSLGVDSRDRAVPQCPRPSCPALEPRGVPALVRGLFVRPHAVEKAAVPELAARPNCSFGSVGGFRGGFLVPLLLAILLLILLGLFVLLAPSPSSSSCASWCSSPF